MELIKKERKIFKSLMISLIILWIILLLIMPVTGAGVIDTSRCIAGTDEPKTFYVAQNSSEYYSCLINYPSDAATLVRGLICSDYLMNARQNFTTPEGAMINPSHESYSADFGYCMGGDNGNGTACATIPTNTTQGEGSFCTFGNYVGIQGYFSMNAYSGDLTRTVYAQWKFLDYPLSVNITVDFNYNIPTNAPLTVTFTDTSIGFTPVYFLWDFGDGEIHTGVESTIQHIYSNYGSYLVKHAATDFGINSGWGNKTITITQITGGGYILTINPNQINLGNFTTVSLTSSHGFNDVSVVSYYTQDTINFEPFTLFASFRKNDDSSWSKTNKSSTPYIPTTDNPFSFKYYPESYGNKTLTAYIYNKTGTYPNEYLALLGIPSTILKVVTSANYPLVNMYLYAYDIYTGAHLSNYTLTLTDYSLGGVSRTWDNVPYQQRVVLNAYDYCNLSASKDGYMDGHTLFTVPLATGNLDNPYNPPQMNQFVGVQLLPLYIGGSTNNFTLIVSAIDSVTKQPIPNFKISISQLKIQRTSDNLGSQIIILTPYDITFSVICSANGYQSQTDYTGSFLPLTLRKIEFNLVKIIPTITPTPIPTTTVIPYQTTGGGVIIKGTLCKYATNLPESIDFFLCTQMGIGDKTTQGIVKAIMIIIAFNLIFLYLGRNSESLGVLALIASILGFVVSLVLGFIELWVLLAILGLGFLAVIVLRGE